MLDSYVGYVGIGALLFVAYLWSDNKKQINWRLVLGGILLTFSLGLLLLKVPGTSNAVLVIGTFVNKLTDYALAGAVFEFGDTLTYGKFYKPGQEALQGEFIFCIRIGVTIVFICGLCSLGYYFGILQRIVSSMGFVLRRTLGLSGAESLSCAASCWVGQVEAQLLIKPYMAALNTVRTVYFNDKLNRHQLPVRRSRCT